MRAVPLEKQLDAAIALYHREFAGQRRDQRDVQRLDEITREARAVLYALERRVGPLRHHERALFEKAKQWIAMFVSERAAIVAEQALPERTPERRFIAEPGGRANTDVAMLRARFALAAERGDIALLYEVIEGLERCERDMAARTPQTVEPWMRDNFLALSASLAACRANEAEIARAMATGGITERRRFLLQFGADLEYFVAWEEKFIRRPAQRPARLRHAAATLTMLANLVRTLGGMTGADADAVVRMDERAESLAARHAVTEAERATLGDTIIAGLGAELASIADVYKQNFAGKQRVEVDLPLLRRVLYRASSIAIQAADIWNATPNDRTAAFRVRSRERQASYEAEESSVAEMQRARRRRT